MYPVTGSAPSAAPYVPLAQVQMVSLPVVDYGTHDGLVVAEAHVV
jgi:hypothetical protein